MLNIVIGYDKNESVAYHVLAHSIMRRASKPVSITGLYLPSLEKSGMYKRERDPRQSTDFTFSRFLTPWITSAMGGRSVFLDCDMLCLTDICELERIASEQLHRDVFVVKHHYTPNPDPKFLGQEQTLYPCKNWSSLMVFNGHRTAVRKLTPSYVNEASPMDLHQFKWANDVGDLPRHWNHLVDEYEYDPAAKIVHFTRGGPWFPQYGTCDYSEQWWDEFYDMASAKGGFAAACVTG